MSASSAGKAAAAGANIADSAYTKARLPFYDFTLRVACGLLWGCPARRVLRFYDEHISGNHLDVGVGSGYFLDHCRYPVENPRLMLLDSNADPLEYSANRLRRFRPETLQANILRPIPFEGRRFDSIGLNHVLHCLPGAMREKAAVIDHLRVLLTPGGKLFGATVPAIGVRHNWVGRKWLAHFNEIGVLDNLNDSADELKAVLEQRFRESSVQVIGRTALFWAR